MCLLPPITNPRKTPSKKGNVKPYLSDHIPNQHLLLPAARLTIHTTTSHLSISSLPGSITIKPKPKPPPPSDPASTYTASYDTARRERDRRHSSLLSEIAFIQCLSAKLHPQQTPTPIPIRAAPQADPNPKPTASETMIVEEIGMLRRELKEKERREEVAAAVARARAEGVREGSEMALVKERESGLRYGGMGDVGMGFLAGLGVGSVSRGDERGLVVEREGLRCRGFDRGFERGLERREDGLDEVFGGVRKVMDSVRRLEARQMDAELDRGIDRVKDSLRYQRRYSFRNDMSGPSRICGRFACQS